MTTIETPDKASCTLHGTLFLTYSTDDVWVSDEWWEDKIRKEEAENEKCDTCTDGI